MKKCLSRAVSGIVLRTRISNCPSGNGLPRAGLLTLLILVGMLAFPAAQISHGGMPYSFLKSTGGTIDTVVLPQVDVKALLAQDAKEQAKGLPFRFGYPFAVDFGMNDSGTWEILPDGSRLWRLRIECPGAFSINLIYDRFHLPEGSTLFLYDEDGTLILGSFTSDNNKADGEFATAPTRGASCILEYHEPARTKEKAEIHISHVVHGYKNVFFGTAEKGFGDSGSCNINVACPEGLPWSNEIRSVAMILLANGSRICSGALVNNVRQDQTPYFLTANHCFDTNYNTWVIMFNYQSPSCENIDGPTTDTVSGTTLKARNSDSDFLLLQLSTPPPDSYNVFFSGWSAIDTPASSAVGIHHPSGDIKKISFDYDPVTSSDYAPSPYLPDSHWRIGVWDAGTTEPGSSGSPLFDPNHRIVGQLHGGWAACNDLRSDFYGKFAMSWARGSTPSSRLKDWLDPDNTGATTLDGINWDGTVPSIPPLVEITSPEANAIVNGTVNIAATASDDDGIDKVEFYIDDTLLATDTMPPYEAAWDTSTYVNGQYQIRVMATDGTGQTNTALRTVVKSSTGQAAMVIDFSSGNDTGLKIQQALAANGYPSLSISSVSTVDPAQFPAIFLCLGYYPTNHPLSVDEGLLLAQYLGAGGQIYMEGGDTWYYDDPTAVHPYFGIEGLSDGADGDVLGLVQGLPGTITSGLTFTAEGVANWVDSLGISAGVTDAEVIWTSIGLGYTVGISRDHGTYRTIGTSFEFGNIPATRRNEVMARYMQFFNLQVFVPGDLNDDGSVTAVDTVILANFLAENPTPAFTADTSSADLDGNGVIDVVDLVLLQLAAMGGSL